MRLLRLPVMLLAFFVCCSSIVQAESRPQPDFLVAPSSPSGSGNESGAQPQANPTGVQPESSYSGGQHVPQDEEGKSQSGQSGPGSASQEPASKILITIDKTRQRMSVSVDGIERYDWPVSTGRAGYSTPSGAFTPTSMNEVWYSKEWDNSPMPHSIFFKKDGHAIHGSYEVKTLGKAVSHGCVRIAPENATTLYTLVKEKGITNAQIILTGTTPGGEWKSARPRYRDTGPWSEPEHMQGFFGGWVRPYGQWYRVR
jgi:lipoprotein-anchoring transpeptidase ErfK/SrfK